MIKQDTKLSQIPEVDARGSYSGPLVPAATHAVGEQRPLLLCTALVPT
jgi:hypothetical protein